MPLKAEADMAQRQVSRRTLKRGQVYTSHDGTELYRQIESVQPTRPIYGEGPDEIIGHVNLIYYWTNRGTDLHRCQRSTFVDWLRVRKARKTQKLRRRSL